MMSLICVCIKWHSVYLSGTHPNNDGNAPDNGCCFSWISRLVTSFTAQLRGGSFPLIINQSTFGALNGIILKFWSNYCERKCICSISQIQTILGRQNVLYNTFSIMGHFTCRFKYLISPFWQYEQMVEIPTMGVQSIFHCLHSFQGLDSVPWSYMLSPFSCGQ